MTRAPVPAPVPVEPAGLLHMRQIRVLMTIATLSESLQEAKRNVIVLHEEASILTRRQALAGPVSAVQLTIFVIYLLILFIMTIAQKVKKVEAQRLEFTCSS